MVKILFTGVKSYEKEVFDAENRSFGFALDYTPKPLRLENVSMAAGYEAVCCFVNDDLSAPVIDALSKQGVKLIALRSTGYDHADLKAAKGKITLVRVASYSPYSVAEHAVGLMLALNRKVHLAYQRTRKGDFSLQGLMGFDMHGKTAGIVGAGHIGKAAARILRGFGMHVLLYDIVKDAAFEKETGAVYTDLNALLAKSEIVSLHTPLNAATRHMINDKTLSHMKEGALLINTGRGALVDTAALIKALKSGKLGGAGLDVYEHEKELFFEDWSGRKIDDPLLKELLALPQVIVTPHQGFFTREAVHAIAQTTLQNVSDFLENKPLKNEIKDH